MDMKPGSNSVLLCLLSLGLSSCVMWSKPRENAPFAPIEEVTAFSGVYRNRADTDGVFSRWLSAVLGFELPIKAIEVPLCVEVKVAKNNEVAVRTWPGPSNEKGFQLGREFEMRKGRAKLDKGFYGIGREGVVGGGYETASIGLDTRGDLKYDTTGAGVGVMLILPLAVAGRDQMRFPRLGGANTKAENAIFEDVYQGTFPCPDCDGLLTTVTLRRTCAGEPRSYDLQVERLKGKEREKSGSSGTWSVETPSEPDGTTRHVRLNSAHDNRLFRLTNGSLIELHPNGSTINDKLNHELDLK